MDNALNLLVTALPKYVAFLFALCFHEWAHGMWALKRGDPTAKLMGRLTLHPLAHADMIGTVVLPLMGFAFGTPVIGWAKPVPVNTRNLTNPRVDMFWIAFAGPLSNVFLALVGTLGLIGVNQAFYGAEMHLPMLQFVAFFIQINLFLAVFNLIPIHPLDGGKVLARFLPESINQKLEENQMLLGVILMVLILSGMLSFLFAPVSWAYQLLINLALGI